MKIQGLIFSAELGVWFISKKRRLDEKPNEINALFKEFHLS